MDKPPPDVANLLCKRMNRTTIKNMWSVNKFWYNHIKRKYLLCKLHYYHCKLCVSRINNSSGFRNNNSIVVCANTTVMKCMRCAETFCKHLKNKRCNKCGRLYDKSPNICGMCVTPIPHACLLK
jgi:hypothetical protein